MTKLGRWMLVSTAIAALGCGDDERERASHEIPRERALEVKACAGGAHTCALTPEGRVSCWGSNLEGQLGDGTRQRRYAPVPVLGVEGVRSIACGRDHTCAIDRSGRVTCWGENEHGELGAGNKRVQLAPTRARGLRDAVELALGADFSCARRADGSVSCWGAGAGGDHTAPQDLEGIRGATTIAAGAAHACAIVNGVLSCWGSNGYGQLGRGEGAPSEGIAPVAGLRGVTAIALGSGHSCAAHASGVSCWGYDSSGQLGDGDGEADRSQVPVAVQGLRGSITALGAGDEYACARSDAGVFCWGDGLEGEGDRHVATQLAGIEGARTLAIGAHHACAITEAGALVCWGSGASGQLGEQERAATPAVIFEEIAEIRGDPSMPATFTAAPGEAPPTPQLAIGRDSVCALTSRGRVRCFGAGIGGVLGNGSERTIDAANATVVRGIDDARQIDAWWEAACAVRANGELACWGKLPVSFGAAELAPSSLPIPIAGVSDAVEVAVGQTMICVRHRAGTVSCLGEGSMGQLGNAANARSDTFVRVQGLEDATQIAAGYASVCARRASGTIACWGYNGHGELGNASVIASNVPIEVAGITGATDVSVDYYNACAVHGGRVSCWGRNNYGQLGNGRMGDDAGSQTPVAIAGVRDAAQVIIYQGTACLVRTNGEAACWGSNNAGQIGANEDPPLPNVTSPRTVAREANVGALGPYVSYAPGMTFTCGLHASGRISCAGNTRILGEDQPRTRAPIEAPGLRLR